MREDIENMKKQVQAVREQSDLIRILAIEDRKNKRLCWLIALLIILLTLSLGYIIYLYNDIRTEETTTTETTTQDIEDVDSIDNSYIINGDNYGKD